MPKQVRYAWARTLVEATGLSALCFVLVLVIGGNGPGEAAVAAVAAAGSPNPTGSEPLHAEVGGLLSAARLRFGPLLRQDLRLRRRTAA